jgi:hypothetical protein
MIEQIKNDSCGPDDSGQDYTDCPNCAAGRIYALECDCCGWSEGQTLRDWSYRRGKVECTKVQSGRRYTLDPVTGDVFIAAAEAGV